ncbi:MAG TPA: hypothetical protein VF054_06595 [Micromonosporaceae bacterium]
MNLSMLVALIRKPSTRLYLASVVGAVLALLWYYGVVDGGGAALYGALTAALFGVPVADVARWYANRPQSEPVTMARASWSVPAAGQEIVSTAMIPPRPDTPPAPPPPSGR